MIYIERGITETSLGVFFYFRKTWVNFNKQGAIWALHTLFLKVSLSKKPVVWMEKSDQRQTWHVSLFQMAFCCDLGCQFSYPFHEPLKPNCQLGLTVQGSFVLSLQSSLTLNYEHCYNRFCILIFLSFWNLYSFIECVTLSFLWHCKKKSLPVNS